MVRVFLSWSLFETDSGRILGRFWRPKSFQNQSQEASSSYWKSLLFLIAFLTLKRSFLWSTWLQHGPIWDQNGTKIKPKTVSEATSAPGPILGRFWVALGSILGRFLVDFWLTLGRFWVGFLISADFGRIVIPWPWSYSEIDDGLLCSIAQHSSTDF